MMLTDTLTTASKHKQNRATHYTGARQAWRESTPYLELDDKAIEPESVPSPLPQSSKRVDSVGVVERSGVFIIVPSPWISPLVNRRAAAFWRSKGFEERRPENSPHVVESYVRQWVRACDVPLNGKLFTAAMWLKAATQKYKELYYEA